MVGNLTVKTICLEYYFFPSGVDSESPFRPPRTSVGFRSCGSGLGEEISSSHFGGSPLLYIFFTLARFTWHLGIAYKVSSSKESLRGGGVCSLLMMLYLLVQQCFPTRRWCRLWIPHERDGCPLTFIQKDNKQAHLVRLKNELLISVPRWTSHKGRRTKPNLKMEGFSHPLPP